MTNYYEGQSTPQITTAISRIYNMKRNVVEYHNRGDIDNYDEYLVANMTYKTGMPHNLISLPEQITVTDYSGNMLRKRQAAYNSLGKPTQIKSYYNSSDYAQIDLEYNDNWGNVTKITLPQNANGQRMYYQYTYDPMLHALPVQVRNALGYISSTQYDYRRGKPVKTVDINNGEMHYRYDVRGRLTKIIAPNEIASGYTDPYTIKMSYPNPETSNYFRSVLLNYSFLSSALSASTAHFDSQHPDNPISTVTVCDGWGRVIQVKKDVEVEGVERTQVSGRTVLDAFGRTLQQYYPVLKNDASALIGVYSPEYETVIPPTTTTYDILDRPLTITDPLGNITTHTYGFDTDFESKKRFITTTTDANGNAVTVYTKSRKQQTQISAPLNTVTKFIYNEMGELLISFDPEDLATTYQYDMAGRCTQRNHPDAGTDIYLFDPAGNMIAHQTQNLINSMDTIIYI
jgi:YD repeat-containing protein